MFYDYEVSPGWWFNAMLLIGKVKSNSTPEEYEDFCKEFVEYIEAPTYILLSQRKKVLPDE